MANHRWAIDKHIIPALGNKDLAKVTPDDIDDLLAKMAKAGAGKATMERVRLILNMAYNDALHRRYVTWNPVTVTKAPKPSSPGRPSRSMTAEQVATFLNAIKGDELEACWLTMLGVGLRPGEVTGLQWSDFELDAEPALLHVRQARLHEPGRMLMGEPKTKGSVRTLEYRATVVMPSVAIARPG